jgi:hypothetical protein
MCPACVASVGLMAAAAGATSCGGGVAMLAFKKFFRKTTQQTKGTENETGRKTNRSGVGS